MEEPVLSRILPLEGVASEIATCLWLSTTGSVDPVDFLYVADLIGLLDVDDWIAGR